MARPQGYLKRTAESEKNKDWILSHHATATEALRLAFEAGANRTISFGDWMKAVNKQLNEGQYLILQDLAPVYRLLEHAATRDAQID